MKKKCKDQRCTKRGELLPLSDFPRDRRSHDQRYVYCKSCCRRRARELRGVKATREYRRRELGIERKPMKLARNGIALSLVYNAIQSGARTREAIHAATELDYDLIGDALTELIFEAGAIRIKNRKFVPIEEIQVAA